MALPMPVVDPQQITDTADALNDWLTCPYTRQALLDWVEASLVSWDFTRQSSPVATDELLQSMLREQYREWVEAQGDIRSVEL